MFWYIHTSPEIRLIRPNAFSMYVIVEKNLYYIKFVSHTCNCISCHRYQLCFSFVELLSLTKFCNSNSNVELLTFIRLHAVCITLRFGPLHQVLFQWTRILFHEQKQYFTSYKLRRSRPLKRCQHATLVIRLIWRLNQSTWDLRKCSLPALRY